MKPTIGRTVHYVLENGEHRPATITNAWSDSEVCNLTVQLDLSNDVQVQGGMGGAASMSMQPRQPGYCKPELIPAGAHALLPGVLAVSSARQGKKPGQWHEPERQ